MKKSNQNSTPWEKNPSQTNFRLIGTLIVAFVAAASLYGHFRLSISRPVSQEGATSIISELVIQSCTKPSLEMLQNMNIICVYDADGEQIPLLEDIPISDADLPDGDLYVDDVQSGRYLADGENLYIVFNSGNIVPIDSHSRSSYDTTVIDSQTGKIVNTMDGKAMTVTIPEPQ